MRPVKGLTKGKHWTLALSHERIRDWARRHGRVPTAADIARDKTRDDHGWRMYPQHTQVLALGYATWDEFLVDAGLEPPKRRNHHKPRHRATLHPRTDHRSR